MGKMLKRGLNALLADIEDVRDEVKAEEKVYTVALDMIRPNPDQPRKTFRKEGLEELASSITTNGIIQPIVVRKDGDKYVIIAGERRYRAAVLAGLKDIPVLIKNYSDVKIREISLIENLQREDLNAIEEASAIRELMTAYGMTQEEIADRLGKSRPALTNTLRLLGLTDEVKDMIVSEKLSAGHGRALLPLEDPDLQTRVARACAEEGWSVRETERRVKTYLTAPQQAVPTKTVNSPEIKRMASDMARLFSAKVRVVGDERKGKICIDYSDSEELMRIYRLIGTLRVD